MKQSVIFTWVILCSIPLFFSFSNISPPMESSEKIIIKVVPMEYKKAFKLWMANLQKKPVRILIKDFKGHTLYSEKVLNHNGYRQLIDLRELDSGKYLIQILHPMESRVGTLRLKAKSVEISWTNQDLAVR